MAESKNNFIRAKMNQDLDDRLIPQGEYRVGQNLTISRSEGDDVGTFQNILGNSSLSKFGIDSVGTEQHINTEVIGYLNDESNDRIFVFLTNYTDSSSNQLSNKAKTGSSHFIIRYDTLTNTSIRLVEGSFLNFSKTHPVLGVNLIENLLFFTDNRNQPRKINVISASSDVSYYNSEDKISVVKFYPHNPPKFYNELIFTASNSSDDASSSNGVIIEINTTGYGANDINLVAAGLKVGLPISLKIDSSPQGLLGRDISVASFTLNIANNKLSIFINSASTWVTGDKIIISTYGLKNCSSPFLPVIFNSEATANSVAAGTYTIKDANGNNPLLTGFSSNYATSEIYVASDTGYSAAKTITSSEGFKVVGFSNLIVMIKDAAGNPPVDLTNTTLNFFRDNPDYDPNFVGDPEYLKDKFVRFSYRYKFDDNEYSLMAPFTQIAFTPKQFGSFIGSDESNAGKTSVVDFMENNVDCIDIFINTPFESPSDFLPIPPSPDSNGWNSTIDKLNIKEIEILCRFAGETSVKIVDVLEVVKIKELSDGGRLSFLKYNYQSTKPIRVLPEKAVTRVFDKAPIKALSQEVSGNRVMYGNFIDKHSSPLNLNYRLAVIPKPDIPLTQDKRTLLNHTLKENRTYQVGLVLQDRYGRSSDVILSNLKDQSIGALNTKFGASTVYNRYSTENDFSAEDILNFTGKQLIIELQDDIPNVLPINGYPGIYSAENPLGWFSYKIVVQQQEQEYYNVYIPNSVSRRQLSENNSLDVSYFSVINDNINKVPKDLSNVGPGEKEFRSSVELFPRVNPGFLTVNSLTEQESFFITPLRKNDEINSIIYNTPELTQADLSLAVGEIKGLSDISPEKVYKGTTANLAEVFNNKPFGSTFGDATVAAIPNFNILGVYETSGFESNLDIYYETSTSGLITELNASVNDSTNEGPVDLTPDVMSLVEDTPIYELGNGTVSSPEFGDVIYTVEVKDYLGIAILNATNTCSIVSVIEANLSSPIIRAGILVANSSSNAVSSSSFIIVPQVSGTPAVNTGRFDIYAKQYFYADDGRTFDFTIEFGIVSGSGSILTKNFTFSGIVNNVRPQYNQQANPGSAQLGDEFIPVDLEPYSNYTRMTGGSSPKSLKPNYYKSPNAGDNKAPQGLGSSPQKGAFPFLCFLESSRSNIRDYPTSGRVFVSSGKAPQAGSGFNTPISSDDKLTVDTYFYGGLTNQGNIGRWGLGTNSWRSQVQNPQDSGGSYQQPMISPYVSHGGMGDQSSMWTLFQMPQKGDNINPSYSAVAFWRKLLYGAVGTEPSLINSTPTFDNYPFQHIYNTNQNTSQRYTPAILKLATDQFVGLPGGFFTGDFYSLINYESFSDASAAKGPWNILEQNQVVSKFTNANGGFNFLNGTKNTSNYQRDIKYGTSVNSTSFSGNVYESFELKDLHFPTGDVFNSPTSPSGRFVDDGTQNPNHNPSPQAGEIESALRKAVHINNQGRVEIRSFILMKNFGFDGDKNYLIPPTVPSPSRPGFSSWFGGIVLNNRLGHGGLYNVGGGMANTFVPAGGWVPYGSYGIFWIGFTVQATDKWGAVTSVPVNLLIIA